MKDIKDDSVIANNSNFALTLSLAPKSNELRDQVELEKLTKEVAKGGSIAFIGSCIEKFAGFLLHIFLGRTLGAATYGLYALGMSIIGIAQLIASLGLNQGIVRYCAIYRSNDDKERIKGTYVLALGLSLLSSALIAILLFSFARIMSEGFFDEPNLISVIRIFALALPFAVLASMTAAFSQSFKRIAYRQGINLFYSFVNLGLVVVAFLLGYRLIGAIFGFLIAKILSAGLGIFLSAKIFPEILIQIKSVYNFRTLIRFSIPTFLAGFSYIILNHSDRIMLGYFSKASEVGIYNAAAIIGMVLILFLGGLIAIMDPIMADLYNQDKLSELSSIYQIVTRWSLTLTLLLFLILAFASQGIMSMFGSEFSKGALVLVIISSGCLVNAGTGPIGHLLQMAGKQDINFIMGLILVLINIGLNIWLIPLFGGVGAALATAISNILIFSGLVFISYKILRIPLFNRYISYPIISGIITVIVTCKLDNIFTLPFLGFNLANIISIVFVYTIMLIIFGLPQEDRLILTFAKKKVFGTRN